MKHLRTLTAAIAVSAMALLGSGASSLAECVNQVNEFPAFSELAPSAQTVLIGTVVKTRPDPKGISALFSVRVDETLRGDPPATLDIEGLRSGLPREGTPACRQNSFVYARTGDVIALALDGRLEGRSGINSVAWIKGRPSHLVPGVQELSRAQATAAAQALPPTDSGDVLSGASGVPYSPTEVAVLLGGLVGGVWAWARVRRRAAG